MIMMMYKPYIAALLLLFASGAVAEEFTTLRPAEPAIPAIQPSGVLRLEHCLVSLIDDVEVPAERPGVLRSLAVKEGDYLEVDAVLGQIDEQLAKLEHATAAAEAAAARAKAENLLETEYATAEYHVREAEYRISLAANKKEANAVSIVELEKLRLAAEQARIKISVSQYERGLRATEAGGFASKAEQAEVDIARRKIRAPVAGEVVELFYRPGEWVEPGKPVLRMVRLDRLRVEGFVPFAEREPSELLNAPVTVRVAFAGGRVETFPGKITFVNPLVQPGGEYRIWAEVDNRKLREQWLLKPGVEAEMEVAAERGRGSEVGGQKEERGQETGDRGQTFEANKPVLPADPSAQIAPGEPNPPAVDPVAPPKKPTPTEADAFVPAPDL